MNQVATALHDRLPRFGDFVLDTADGRLLGPEGSVHLGGRAFQVLVMLVAHAGQLVAKETLFEAVWTGLHVSDSVLTVAIKELRKALGDQARDPTFIESVYGRGYRFVAPVSMVARTRTSVADVEWPSVALRHTPYHITRRSMLAGAAAMGVAGIAGASAIWLFQPRRTPGAPAEVEALVTRARDALDRGTDDDEDQAIALMRRVVALAPRYADGWGLLGLANAVTSHFRERSLGLDLRAHAEAAARRALDLDPSNGLGQLALGVALPLVGAWSARERHLRRALEIAPATEEVLEYVAVCKIFAGQASAALPLYERMRRPFQPQTFANYCQALWRTGRLEELDRALDEAASLYPAQPRLWANQISIYLYGDRVDRALEMLDKPAGRPRNVSEETIAGLREIAGALRDPQGPQAEMVAAKYVAHERRIAAATEAIRVLASLGRTEPAMTVVEALFFGTTYVIADWDGAAEAFTPEQRDTRILFEPSTTALRADARFETVVARLGLDAFWRRYQSLPDYRANGPRS
jgi:DNA-binding winged helix-turn-helix (wHTH) protein